MNNEKKIKIVYYVDVDDNTKGCVCAIPSDKDMRNPKVVEKIANAIEEILSPIHVLIGDLKMELAKGVAFHGYANIYGYEFGIEETNLFDF